MAYTLRKGTNKKKFLSLEGAEAQSYLEEAYLANHQLYCSCRYPNPILDLSHSAGFYKVKSFSDLALIPHAPSCIFNREPQCPDNNERSMLDQLWSMAQLNIWSPKMSSKRNKNTLMKALNKSGESLNIRLELLSEFNTNREARESIETRYFFGQVRFIDNDGVKINIYDKDKIPSSDTEMNDKYATALKKYKNIRVFCLLNSRDPTKLKLIMTDKNYLPVNDMRVQQSIWAIVEAVKSKKRFYIGSRAKEVVEF